MGVFVKFTGFHHEGTLSEEYDIGAETGHMGRKIPLN